MPRKMTYKQMREAGLCVICGKPSEKSKCEECLKKQMDYQRGNIKLFREIGLCKCGNKPVKGKRSCQECLDKSKEYYWKSGRMKYIERRAVRKSKGDCVVCGKRKATYGLRCKECTDRDRINKFNLYFGAPII